MSETTAALEQESRQLLARLDAMDFDGLRRMFTDDAQGIDEISRNWTRGRDALDAYLSQLEGTVADVHSQISDLNASAWGDAGLVTFVLDQTYTMNGEQQKLTAPTSLVYRREGGDWKVVLIHSVPIADAG